MRLAIAVTVRADKTEAQRAFEKTQGEMAQEAARLTRASGQKAYALVDERHFERNLIRRSLDARAVESQALIREWIIELGGPARPRGDNRSWVAVTP